MKRLRFVGSSLDDLRNFPAEARRQADFELYAVQRGQEPSNWKPMKTIGSGVREIRVRVLGEWRIIYVAKVCQCCIRVTRFSEKTQKTSHKDIEIARRRYRQIRG
ncbi:MAG TPA: type II toxin-antitoxin system RelE/ParE family toxin [Anaerolineae bacterium]|nr:type II toxin-antitoxin system RelE/ParE family toxin [Anaerolineae bacterium]HIP73377.1 type II toxin-antitoxin system RelE/ParE family toxin [Anaerolineae bacterium]